MTRRNRRKNRKYKPYEQVKMEFFSIADPFGDAPLEVRRQILRNIGAKAKATFEREFSQVQTWFDRYDPIYILAFCPYYFLTAEQGVDKEAIDGKLDFGPTHLELLQAIALMQPRGGTPEPLQERAQELQESLKRLTDALINSSFDVPGDISSAELKKQFVLSQMRLQTLAIRNWAFPDQAIAHLTAFCSGPFGTVLSKQYGGVSGTRLIDALVNIVKEIEHRLNTHRSKVVPMIRASTFDLACSAYRHSFPDITLDTKEMRSFFNERCDADLQTFKWVLLTHSDLRLPDIFMFTLDDFMRLYGSPEHRDAIKTILEKWSYRFGGLAGRNPYHFLYSNPVLQRPFIVIGDDKYCWVLCGLLSHTLPGLIEGLVASENRKRYLECRSKYLEDTVANLCRDTFPDGHIYQGSLWRPTDDDATLYENDVLVVIDSTAFVIECKAHLVDPPARRGAEFRLVETLEDVVVKSSIQANRFVSFLKSHIGVHHFRTNDKTINTVDTSNVVRYVPFSVTYENLGYISANLKESVEAGLIDSQYPLVPSICITDLEIAFELLDTQSQCIHYLSRRAEIEKTMKYSGDEGDLLAFYLESGFNVGEWEDGKILVDLNMKSKELDPYFIARANGVSVRKPHLEISVYWRVLLDRVERLKSKFWTEIAYVLLNIGRKDQDKFEKTFKKLIKRVQTGKVKQKYNWVVMLNGDGEARKYAVVGFPYRTNSREERNEMMKHMAGELEQNTPVLGMVIIGTNVDVLTYPYDVLAYVPGHAPGAPDFDRVLGGTQ